MRGYIGMMLEQGQTVLTKTGRETTPFPKLSFATNRKTISTCKRVDAWLRAEAIVEATCRADDFCLMLFNHSNLKNLSQSDKDSFEEYLFISR